MIAADKEILEGELQGWQKCEVEQRLMLHERLLSMYDEHHCEKAAGNHIESQATVDTVDT